MEFFDQKLQIHYGSRCALALETLCCTIGKGASRHIGQRSAKTLFVFPVSDSIAGRSKDRSAVSLMIGACVRDTEVRGREQMCIYTSDH